MGDGDEIAWTFDAKAEVTRKGVLTMRPLQSGVRVNPYGAPSRGVNANPGREIGADVVHREVPTGAGVLEQIDAGALACHVSKAGFKPEGIDSHINYIQRRFGMARGRGGQWDDRCQAELAKWLEKPKAGWRPDAADVLPIEDAQADVLPIEDAPDVPVADADDDASSQASKKSGSSENSDKSSSCSEQSDNDQGGVSEDEEPAAPESSDVTIISSATGESFEMKLGLTTPISDVIARASLAFGMPREKVLVYRKQLLRDGVIGQDNKFATIVIDRAT